MKKCPRCHRMTLKNREVLNALSRRDNKTYICSQCGRDEAFIDAGLVVPGKWERDFVAKIEYGWING